MTVTLAPLTCCLALSSARPMRRGVTPDPVVSDDVGPDVEEDADVGEEADVDELAGCVADPVGCSLPVGAGEGCVASDVAESSLADCPMA